MTTKRVLIISHEKWETQGLARSLTQAKFQTRTIGIDEKTIKKVYEMAPNIVIMADITPKEYPICSKIIEMPRLPVILVPAGEVEQSNASALNLGADEYMSSPVYGLELVARAHSLLRRYRKPYAYRIHLHPHNCMIEIADHIATLSPVQFRLLTCLSLNEGKLMSYSYLANEVLDNSISVNTLHFHMRRLKQKLESIDIKPYRLFQFRGEGYYFSRGSGIIDSHDVEKANDIRAKNLPPS